MCCLLLSRFSAESVSGSSLAKSSVSRNIKKSILETYPQLGEADPTVKLAADADEESRPSHLDSILGDKKQPLYILKSPDRIQFISINKVPKFFQIHDDEWIPTLRLLHQYPDLLPTVQVDRGAIKFVMKGADIMCPGLTSAGGDISTPIEKDTIVAIKAEGKEQILALGKTVMSTEDMKKINADTAIESIHYLNDGLWNTPTIE